MISHELRTPLTSIRSFAEILRDTPDIAADKRQQFLSIMVLESQRLSRLIEEILDLARLESGRLTMKPVAVDLTKLAKQSSDAIFRLHDEQSVEFEFFAEASPAIVTADPDRLEQVIINLLENARKFAAPRHPNIRLSVYPVDNTFQLSVEDNGPGIPPSERENVFEKFYQLQLREHATEKGRPKGSGLGLPISRAIIHHLGGKLWATESPLGGTKMVLELPKASFM